MLKCARRAPYALLAIHNKHKRIPVRRVGMDASPICMCLYMYTCLPVASKEQGYLGETVVAIDVSIPFFATTMRVAALVTSYKTVRLLCSACICAPSQYVHMSACCFETTKVTPVKPWLL